MEEAKGDSPAKDSDQPYSLPAPEEEGSFSFRDALSCPAKAETSASGEVDGSRKAGFGSMVSDGSDAKQTHLLRFLERHRLEFLFGVLVETGYDDLDQLLFQMRSAMPLDMTALEAIGIQHYSHRAMLLAALEQAAGVHRVEPEERLSMCCEQNTRAISFHNHYSLKEWLGDMGLEALHPQFVAAGYVHLEPLIHSMNSSYPLTDTLLQQEVKIQRAEDRHRILRKLTQAANAASRLQGVQLEREAIQPACDCRLM
jgi:hypothetical protein